MFDFKDHLIQYYLLACLEFKTDIKNCIYLYASDLKRLENVIGIRYHY